MVYKDFCSNVQALTGEDNTSQTQGDQVVPCERYTGNQHGP